MFAWLLRLLLRRNQIRLVCEPLSEMHRTHPNQITRICSRCYKSVGVFPSGQNVLLRHGERNVDIVCKHCDPVGGMAGTPAPGAIEEMLSFVPKDEVRHGQ
jgi:hypothetical protein